MCITPHCWKNFSDRLTRFQLRREFLYTIPIMIRHIMKPPFYGIFLLLWRHNFVNINNTFRADKCPYQILLFWVSFLSFHLQKNDYHYPKYEAIELIYWIYLSFLVQSIKWFQILVEKYLVIIMTFLLYKDSLLQPLLATNKDRTRFWIFLFSERTITMNYMVCLQQPCKIDSLKYHTEDSFT